MLHKKYTIWVSAVDESNLEDALRTAMSSVEEGYTSGANKNGQSAYSFESTDNVPDDEQLMDESELYSDDETEEGEE